MGTVLEDLTSETINAEHIRRRVTNWKARLNGLFASIRGWLPEGWEARDGEPVYMHEDLMRKFGIAATHMPSLKLQDSAGHVVRIVPRGLWIVGVNGRVDLKNHRHHYLILDMSKNFEQPDWQAARADQRHVREIVNEDWLRRVLQ